jgi:hypothetical protein
MLRRVALVRTDVSDELSAYFIRVTRIGDLGTTLAPKRRFLQEPHCVTSQKTTFFIVTAVKTSNLTIDSQMAVMLSDLFAGRPVQEDLW